MTDRFGELIPSPPSWIFTAGSAPLSYLFTSATVLIHMHQSVALTKSARRSIAPSQKRRRNHLSYVRTEALSGMNFVPAQKLYIFFLCEHCLNQVHECHYVYNNFSIWFAWFYANKWTPSIFWFRVFWQQLNLCSKKFENRRQVSLFFPN